MVCIILAKELKFQVNHYWFLIADKRVLRGVTYFWQNADMSQVINELRGQPLALYYTIVVTYQRID